MIPQNLLRILLISLLICTWTQRSYTCSIILAALGINLDDPAENVHKLALELAGLGPVGTLSAKLFIVWCVRDLFRRTASQRECVLTSSSGFRLTARCHIANKSMHLQLRPDWCHNRRVALILLKLIPETKAFCCSKSFERRSPEQKKRLLFEDRVRMLYAVRGCFSNVLVLAMSFLLGGSHRWTNRFKCSAGSWADCLQMLARFFLDRFGRCLNVDSSDRCDSIVQNLVRRQQSELPVKRSR